MVLDSGGARLEPAGAGDSHCAPAAACPPSCRQRGLLNPSDPIHGARVGGCSSSVTYYSVPTPFWKEICHAHSRILTVNVNFEEKKSSARSLPTWRNKMLMNIYEYLRAPMCLSHHRHHLLILLSFMFYRSLAFKNFF